jgi:tetratricopeptide (TPR) repeat protein
LEDCNRSIKIDPNYSKPYGRMGLAYASLNDHLRAKEMYEKAIELDPSNQNYHCNLKIATEKIEEQQVDRSSPISLSQIFMLLHFPIFTETKPVRIDVW